MYIHTHKQTYLYLYLYPAAYQYIYHAYLSTSIRMRHAPSCFSAADDSVILLRLFFIFLFSLFFSLHSSIAACYGHTAAVDLLLETKAVVDATNEHGWTPLQAR
jgi:hypothetical protein